MLEQLRNLTLVDWFLIPFRPLYRRAWSTCWEAVPLVLDIEPLGLSFDYFIAKTIRDIHSILPLPKLETRTSYYVLNKGVWLRFQVEKESEELKMGLDAQKSFAQMHKDRNMNKRIGVK